MRKPFLLFAACGASFTLVPAVAQAGFLETLFGLAAPAPAQAPAAASSGSQEPRASGRRRHRAEYEPREHRHYEHAKVATKATTKVASNVSGKPKLQKTTGLMDDRTLRSGDAVMTKEGLRIFTGEQAAHHEKDEFVALRDAPHGKKGSRLVLAAIDDAARLDVGRDRRAELHTGRSVSTADVERRPSFTKPDVSVRYVGP